MGVGTQKINEKEQKCLQLLAEYFDHDANCLFMGYIAEETKLTVKEVRRAVRSLAKKGLTEFVRGLFDEDTGLIAGSGYCCTRAGLEFLNGDSPQKDKL